MLTLQRCRELLGDDCPLTDEDLMAVRNTLYAVAKIALNAVETFNGPPGDEATGVDES
jgi:hypothetical protein